MCSGVLGRVADMEQHEPGIAEMRGEPVRRDHEALPVRGRLGHGGEGQGENEKGCESSGVGHGEETHGARKGLTDSTVRRGCAPRPRLL
jgi:hypothetical protein